MQAEDPGCLWGCGLTLALLPVFMVVQFIDERNKQQGGAP